MIPPLPKPAKVSPATKAAVLRNSKLHADEANHFVRVFERRLDDFWGRPGKDCDGVVRQQPSNVTGFDLETFMAAFELGPTPDRLTKASRKRFLGLAKKKWGDGGVEVLTRLLPPLRSPKRK